MWPDIDDETLDELDDQFGDLDLEFDHSDAEWYKLFVYGTLMRDRRNHARMLCEGVQFIAQAKTIRQTYEMQTRLVGERFWAPAVRVTTVGRGYGVIGELYRVREDVLERLDAYEGHPEVYERQAVNVTTLGASPKTHPCEMYVFQPEFDSDMTTRGIQIRFNSYYWQA